MPIDSHLLIGLRAVMENGSVTRAAAILGITQPAMSAKLARLERELGFALFERDGGNRLRPTSRGLDFFEAARPALALLDRLDITAERLRTGATGTLVMASHPSASISVLPGAIAAFRAEMPEVAVKLINRTSEEVRSYFEASVVDIAVAELPVELANVEKRRYAIDCVAILPSGHPSAARDVIGPGDLAGLPFVSMTTGRTIGHQIRNAVVESGGAFGRVIEAEYFSTICALVAQGQGVSIVDVWSAEMFRPLGLEVRRLDPPVQYEIAVFYRADRPRSAAALLMLDIIDRRLRIAPALPAGSAGTQPPA
jgi:DNA-binding transcriptional LysR family regulator